MLSPVYYHIRIYRIVMFLLYGGSYSSRYNLIFNYIKIQEPKKILELCFGDILLAEFCRKNQIEWQGIDQNERFIRNAQRKGFNVLKSDITKLQHLPLADMLVISGALYHFHDKIDQLFELILKSTGQLLISEHVINFDSTKGIIGFFGGLISNAGNRNEPFRYNQASLEELIKKISTRYNLQYHFIGHYKWDDVYLLKH